MRSMVEGSLTPRSMICPRNYEAGASYPSTTLRVVPLPTAFGGREEPR